MCVKAHVCTCKCLKVCMLAFMPPGRGRGEGGRRGGGVVTLEPFQLLMHYRQIGPQIGLFAVD